MAKAVQRIIVALCVIVAVIAWYCIAADYDYGALAGTYVVSEGEDTCILHLRSDHTFRQEVRKPGITQLARGDWHRMGEAGVEFSSAFLRIPGETLGPSGERYGHFYKILGLLPVLVLDPDPGGPRLHRRLLHWQN